MDTRSSVRQLALLAIDRMHHCEARGLSHDEAGRMWRRTGVMLSATTAVVAAGSAAAVAGDSNPVIAGLGLVAALLGAVTGALTPASRASKHSAAAVAYRALRTRIVDFLSLDVFETEITLAVISPNKMDELRGRLSQFSEATNSLDAASPDVTVRPKYNPRDREAYVGENSWWRSEDALKLAADSTGGSQSISLDPTV